MGKNKNNNLGQYFTPENIADFMISLLPLNKNNKILEPSAGEGIFINLLENKGFHNVDGIEFDRKLKKKANTNIKYGDYLLMDSLENKYDGVIGNPPYVRWKNLSNELKANLSESKTWKRYCNSLSDYYVAFIAKAVNDLKKGGALVFITPEYWLYTKHAQKLRNHLLSNGSIDKIFHFEESKIFEGVSSSLIIFRFLKDKKLKTNVTKILSRQNLQNLPLLNLFKNKLINFKTFETAEFQNDKRWSLEEKKLTKKLDKFEKNCSKNNTQDFFDTKVSSIGDICDIANGMVSGLDKAFQLQPLNSELTAEEKKSLLRVAKAKQLDGIGSMGITKYIYIREKITENYLRNNLANFYIQLQGYKDKLLSRYKYNDDSNYWEWSFLRNLKTLSKKNSKIFVPCKERIGTNKSFRFSIVNEGVYATQDVTAIIPKDSTKESIFYIHAFLLLPIVTDWIKTRGVMRGGVAEFSEEPISSIPFRKINWKESKEVKIHNKISSYGAERFKANISMDHKTVNQLSKKIIELFNNLL